MAAAQRIGLFGGSFDPVHLGHVMVARAAIEELQLTRLFLIPAARSPFKTDETPAAAPHRLRLLRLAFAGWNDCEVDAQEMARDGASASYSINAVRDYAARFTGASLHYLIGADHVPTLPQWREAAALAALVTFAVMSRPGETPVDFPAPFHGTWLRGQPMAVAASDIRRRARAGLSIDHLVPAAVAGAIRELKLYT